MKKHKIVAILLIIAMLLSFSTVCFAEDIPDGGDPIVTTPTNTQNTELPTQTGQDDLGDPDPDDIPAPGDPDKDNPAPNSDLGNPDDGNPVPASDPDEGQPALPSDPDDTPDPNGNPSDDDDPDTADLLGESKAMTGNIDDSVLSLLTDLDDTDSDDPIGGSEFNERYVQRKDNMNKLLCPVYLQLPLYPNEDGFEFNTYTGAAAYNTRFSYYGLVGMEIEEEFWIHDDIFGTYQKFSDEDGKTCNDYASADTYRLDEGNSFDVAVIYASDYNSHYAVADFTEGYEQFCEKPYDIQIWHIRIENGYIYFERGDDVFKADMSTFRWCLYNRYNGQGFGWNDCYCDLWGTVDWKKVPTDAEKDVFMKMDSVTTEYDGLSFDPEHDEPNMTPVDASFDGSSLTRVGESPDGRYQLTIHKMASNTIIQDYQRQIVDGSLSMYQTVPPDSDEEYYDYGRVTMSPITHVGTRDITYYPHIVKLACGEESCPLAKVEIEYWEYNLATFTVTPAPYSVTTGSDEKVDDGTPLTCAEYTLTPLKNGETVGIRTTGIQEGVGSSSNPYEITWGGEYTALQSDYYLNKEELGTLTITKSRNSVPTTPTDDPPADDPPADNPPSDPVPPVDNPTIDNPPADNPPSHVPGKTPSDTPSETPSTPQVLDPVPNTGSPENDNEVVIQFNTPVSTPDTTSSDETTPDGVIKVRSPQTGDDSYITLRFCIIVLCLGIILLISGIRGTRKDRKSACSDKSGHDTK